jgi:PKD repeat protein
MNKFILQKNLIAIILCLGSLIFLMQDSEADHTTTSATLSASTTAGNYPLDVTFQVAVSPSSDAGCAADSYTLDFGDGSIAMGDSTGPGNVSHTYMTPGIYTAQLDYSMEADHGGFSVVCAPGAARSQVNINVMIAQALIPEFVVTQIPGPLPVEVRFSALPSSTDPVCAPISRFEWDFGDGSPTGMGSFVAHNYEQEGSFDVSLSLRDDCGREVSSSMTVEISGEDGETGGSEDEDTNGEEENGTGEDEEIELSPQQVQINVGVQTIYLLFDDLKAKIRSTNELVRNFMESDEDLSDAAYELIVERLDQALILFSLIQMEIEPLEVLEEAQGTVFFEHLQILKELLLDDDTGINLHAESARDAARDRDLERVQFDLEDAIFLFTHGPLTFEDWSDVLQFDDVYRCRTKLATVIVGMFSLLNPNASHTFTGTNNADVINGSPFDDVINGLGGDDWICGAAGNDTIDAGTGNDSVFAGTGDDMIRGGAGDDGLLGERGSNTIYGDAGNDDILGGVNNDIIYGGIGNDTINGFFGDDEIYGEAGIDEIDGQDGTDLIDGGAGNDILKGGNDGDIIYGGPDNDFINGDSGSDVIFGDDGADGIIGGSGTDTLFGGAGDDSLAGDESESDPGDAKDTCDGGTGSDIAQHCKVEFNIP